MPLTRFLGDTSFGPDEIAVLVSAYEAAMRELDLPGPTAPGVETLAMTIIRFAKQGERDPLPEPPMKWAHHPNLRKRPCTPAKGRGSVQRAIKRAFAATSASALTSTQIYDWAHVRRRLGRRKSMPFGVYSRTLRTLRAMCEPIERVPPHGAWLWRLRDSGENEAK